MHSLTSQSSVGLTFVLSPRKVHEELSLSFWQLLCCRLCWDWFALLKYAPCTEMKLLLLGVQRNMV